MTEDYLVTLPRDDDGNTSRASLHRPILNYIVSVDSGRLCIITHFVGVLTKQQPWRGRGSDKYPTWVDKQDVFFDQSDVRESFSSVPCGMLILGRQKFLLRFSPRKGVVYITLQISLFVLKRVY